MYVLHELLDSSSNRILRHNTSHLYEISNKRNISLQDVCKEVNGFGLSFTYAIQC